jgi:SAM-dependent methyltransferase
MADWSHGYDVSMGYTYGFHREMAPNWLDFATRAAGFEPRREGVSSPLRYLELGCGQGFGLCLLAAANPDTDFVGVDFHPDHIAHAKGLADAAGLANIAFHQADFLDLAAAWPNDFGSFDHVALHGIYSWVPPRIRQAVIECLAHATHPGSLVHVSYNAQPGWLSTMPFQHITHRIKETSGKPSDAVLADSIALFDRLRAGGAVTFQLLPALKARIQSVKTAKTNYLAQEYLDEGWSPFWHSEVAKALEPAGLGYFASATLPDAMLPGVLPPPLRDAVLSQPDAGLRQDIADFVINQSFRRDLFGRKPRRLAVGDNPALLQTRLHLVSPPPSGEVLKVSTAFGEVALDPRVYGQLLELLGEGTRSVADLAALPQMREQGLANTVQILLLLLHAGVLGLAGEGSGSAAALNCKIAQAVCDGVPYGHLAAPALGSAVAVDETDLMLLDAWHESAGHADAARLMDGVRARRAALSRDPADTQLAARAEHFLATRLPEWRRLGAVD